MLITKCGNGQYKCFMKDQNTSCEWTMKFCGDTAEMVILLFYKLKILISINCIFSAART